MEVSDAELINEFEYQYYGFSPAGITDSVYNQALKSWEEAVEKWFRTEPSLEMVSSNKKFREEIIGMIFYRREVKQAFSIFTDRVLKYILRIPRYVTLPEHEASYRLLLSDEPSLSDTELHCELLAKRIIENRFTLDDLKNDLQEANDVIEVLSFLVNKLESADQ